MQPDGDEAAYQRFVERMQKGRSPLVTDEESSSSCCDHGQPIIATISGLGPIEQLQEKGLLNGRDHKSCKFREPSDIQQRQQDHEIKKEKPQPLGPLNVIPRRENQNEYVLRTGGKRKGDFPPLQEEITERALLNREHKVDAFPIEDMMLRGFMPHYSYNIDDIICTASNELYREYIIINNKNATLAAKEKAENGSNAHKKRKTKHNDTEGDAASSMNDDGKPYNESMTVKPASQFSWDIPNYGSNSTTGKAELYEKVRVYYMDCMERMNRFFIDDQLEEAYLDTSVPHQHRPPRDFAIYRETESQLKMRFQERLSILKDSASRVPKFDDEPPITKQWINSYRLRPSTTDELCSRGTECLFNCSKKDNMRYIGRVFETPREVKEKRDSPSSPYIRNTNRLCIDCLLDAWTIGTYEAVASEKACLVQRNFFTVLCEPGQYSKNCMLPTTMNDKETGITGYVPMYNQNKRISEPIKIQQIEGNHFYHISTNYLAETGMDFQ